MLRLSNDHTPMKELNDNKELQRSAPTLFGLPKQDPFVVEDSFFQRFPHEVQALASKSAQTPAFTWLKRAAVALPAVALVLFAVFSLRGPGTSVASAPVTEEALISAASEQFDTETILANVPAEDWPVFDSVTVQLTPTEALAYVDQHDIDLTEYLNQQ